MEPGSEVDLYDIQDEHSSSSSPAMRQDIFQQDGIYAHDLLVDNTLLNKVISQHLTLKEQEAFGKKSLFSKMCKSLTPRKNEILHCISSREYPLDIKLTDGLTEVLLVLQEKLSQKLRLIPEGKRRQMGYIHISCIKIMIKSTFRLGINSPIKLALLDRRMVNPTDALFGGLQGNLAYGKLIFTCKPNISVSLRDADINKLLCLAHEFERQDLMQDGNHPFTITYMLGYALTNSHHSMTFCHDKFVQMDDLFKDVGRISNIPMQETRPLDNIWAMDLSRKRLLGEPARLLITEGPRGDQRRLDRSRSNHQERAVSRAVSRFQGIPPVDDIRMVSKRINRLTVELDG